MNTANVTAIPTPRGGAGADRAEACWEWFDEETGNPLDGYEREWGWRCSACGHVLPDDYDDPDTPPKMNFCSNCGADMRKGGCQR